MTRIFSSVPKMHVLGCILFNFNFAKNDKSCEDEEEEAGHSNANTLEDRTLSAFIWNFQS